MFLPTLFAQPCTEPNSVSIMKKLPFRPAQIFINQTNIVVSNYANKLFIQLVKKTKRIITHYTLKINSVNCSRSTIPIYSFIKWVKQSQN